MDDLDALLADLGGGGGETTKPVVQARRAPSIASTPQVHTPSNTNVDELDSLMNELGTSHTAAAPVSQADDDLDSLLGELSGGSMTTTKPVSKPTPVAQPSMNATDDLDSLLNDLNGNNIQATPTPGKQPARRAGTVRRAPVQPKAQQAVNSNLSSPSSELDELDGLLNELGGSQEPTPTARKATSPVVSPPPSHKPTPETESLDSLLSELAMDPAPTTSAPQAVRKAPAANSVHQPKPSRQGGVMPKPQVAPDQLGDVMAHLRGEMSSLDPNAPAARGICHVCHKAIHGEVVAACGKTYHPEHFTCSNCQQSLAGQNFYDQDGDPQCQRCYSNTYCAKCAYCSQPIVSSCINALNKRYHPEHFICVKCLKPFADGQFYERDGAPYCATCYRAASRYMCGGCQGPIEGDVINALGKHWHPEHFVCATCSCSFGGGLFYAREGKPYCKEHYQMESGANCAECGLAISGRVVNALNKRFHPQCFCCQFCMQPLGGKPYEVHDGQQYCRPCSGRLF